MPHPLTRQLDLPVPVPESQSADAEKVARIQSLPPTTDAYGLFYRYSSDGSGDASTVVFSTTGAFAFDFDLRSSQALFPISLRLLLGEHGIVVLPQSARSTVRLGRTSLVKLTDAPCRHGFACPSFR